MFVQSNFRIKDKMGTPVLSIVEKLSPLGNHHFLTVYLIFDCTKCIRLYKLSEKYINKIIEHSILAFWTKNNHINQSVLTMKIFLSSQYCLQLVLTLWLLLCGHDAPNMSLHFPIASFKLFNFGEGENKWVVTIIIIFSSCWWKKLDSLSQSFMELFDEVNAHRVHCASTTCPRSTHFPL